MKTRVLLGMTLTALIMGATFIGSNSVALAAEKITEISQHDGCLPSKSGGGYCRKQVHWRGKVYCNNGRVLTAQQSKFQHDHNGNWDIQTSSGQYYEFGGMGKAERACKR